MRPCTGHRCQRVRIDSVGSTRVTVAVPVFNGGLFLGQTLESLLRQQYEDFEIVVIDDGSTDDSVAIAESAGVRVERNEVRRGLAGNWNAAFAVAQTPFLLIAHQDDVYLPGFLAATSALLRRYPHAFIAHTRSMTIDASGFPIQTPASRYKDRFWPRDEPYERGQQIELEMLQRGNYIVCPAVLYRMEAVERIGAFDERYRFVPDWDYWTRGLIGGFTVAGTHERLLQRREHGANATRAEEASLRRYEEELELLERLSRDAGLPRKMTAVENTLLSDFARRLASGDGEGATSLRRFAREHLSDASRLHAIMSLGAATGRIGGILLRLAEAAYVRLR